MSSSLIEHKRGDTFKVTCYYQDGSDRPLSLAGITIASQIRHKTGALIADLDAEVIDEGGGEYTLEYAGSTQDWPIDKLQWDIQYSQGGVDFSTETICVQIVRDVTQP